MLLFEVYFQIQSPARLDTLVDQIQPANRQLIISNNKKVQCFSKYGAGPTGSSNMTGGALTNWMF